MTVLVVYTDDMLSFCSNLKNPARMDSCFALHLLHAMLWQYTRSTLLITYVECLFSLQLTAAVTGW